MRLTAAEARRFDAVGYLFLPGLFDAAEMAAAAAG